MGRGAWGVGRGAWGVGRRHIDHTIHIWLADRWQIGGACVGLLGPVLVARGRSEGAREREVIARLESVVRCVLCPVGRVLSVYCV